MDLSKLTTADKVIAGSAIAYLIFMFFPWYGIDDFGSNSGWDYFLTGIIPLILAIFMVAHIGVTRFSPDTKLPDTPVPWGQVHMIAGIAAAVLLLLRTLITSSVDVVGFGDFDLDREFGLFLALLATICLAVGGVMKSKEVEDGSSIGSGPTTPF